MTSAEENPIHWIMCKFEAEPRPCICCTQALQERDMPTNEEVESASIEYAKANLTLHGNESILRMAHRHGIFWALDWMRGKRDE